MSTINYELDIVQIISHLEVLEPHPALCKRAGGAGGADCTFRARACTTRAREMVVEELHLLLYQWSTWRHSLLSVILDPWEPLLKNE